MPHRITIPGHHSIQIVLCRRKRSTSEWFGQQQEQRKHPPRTKQEGNLYVDMHQYACVSLTLGLSYTACTLGLTVQHPLLR